MSTEIKKITGRYEESHNGNFTVNYNDSDINLTRFAGGIKNGAMLQITISNSKDCAYVQLTQSQVKLLIDTLKDSFNYSKYPSD
jgi:hypothetical protein